MNCENCRKHFVEINKHYAKNHKCAWYMTKKEIDNLKEDTLYEKMRIFDKLIKKDRVSKVNIMSYFLSKYPYLNEEIHNYIYYL